MIRAVRLAAALVLVCLGLLANLSAPASAADCTCRQGTLKQQVARADAVFIGTIDRVEKAGNDFTYDVTAARTYEGTPEQSTQVFSAGGPNACGLGALRVGTTYIFLATGTEAPYESDSCSGTSVRNDAKVTQIEGLLGEGTSVEPPPPPKAVRTLVEDSPPGGFARTAAPGAAAAIIGVLGLMVVRRMGRR